MRKKRTYVNSAKTIMERKETGVSKRQPVKIGIHRKMQVWNKNKNIKWAKRKFEMSVVSLVIDILMKANK